MWLFHEAKTKNGRGKKERNDNWNFATENSCVLMSCSWTWVLMCVCLFLYQSTEFLFLLFISLFSLSRLNGKEKPEGKQRIWIKPVPIYKEWGKLCCFIWKQVKTIHQEQNKKHLNGFKAIKGFSEKKPHTSMSTVCVNTVRHSMSLQWFTQARLFCVHVSFPVIN